MTATVWLIAGIALLILEIVAPSFVFCWFGLAGLLVAGLAFTGVLSLAVQLTVFSVISILLVLASRTVFKNIFMRGSPGKSVVSNTEALTGQTAQVLLPTDGTQGQVQLHGMEWTARSDDGALLEKGAQVQVVRTDGVKLIVKKA